MPDETLEQLSRQLSPARDLDNPPLHLWQPALSGDIDIVIHRDGSWHHEGAVIERASLVRLFASILRREADGDYYLVTPVEKWRIRVEDLPLQIVDFDIENPASAEQTFVVSTNTGRRYVIGEKYPLYMPAASGEFEVIPAVSLDHGLAASFSRAAWYRLAEACQEREGQAGISSEGLFFPIAA
ncbi:MAG: DUF1285 domain-containing protein [Halieaceae bacterium]